MEFKLEKITPTSHQTKVLFKLLSERKYNISNQSMPEFFEHEEFVRDNPYLVWYLIKIKDNYEGSIYVNKDNSIGLNNCDNLSHIQLKKILELLGEQNKPLASIPSMRFGEFFLNVAISNKNLQKKLELLGYEPSQVSYVFKGKK